MKVDTADQKPIRSADDVIYLIKQSGIQSVRLSIADQHGVLRGKVILAEDLVSAFKNGVPITSTLLLKDTSHATVFPVWQEDAGFGKGQLTGASDLRMLPDASTFRPLSWSTNTGWMLCDLVSRDLKPLGLSTRNVLATAIEKLARHQLELVCGLEVEFYVYRLEQSNLSHADSGRPHRPPDTSLLSHGYQYLTEQTYDQLEPVMALIQQHAIQLGLPLRTMEAEFGPSQFEMTFQPADAMETADNMMLFRSMVKQVCRREGYHATFMCRPALPNAMGNGWHMHQSLVDTRTGKNVFIPEEGEQLSEMGSRWIAGLLAHAAESCLLSTPTVNGYKRYQPFALAPDRIQWGRDNRGAMIRSLCDPADPASRIENRIGESAANPYLYIASQILSGLDGLDGDLVLPDPVESPYENESLRLPNTLDEALQAFCQSRFYRQSLGDEFVDYLSHIKQSEWQRYTQTVSEWEQREYFSLF